MNKSTKYTYIIAFALFFVGDLSTTYYALSNGGTEGNILLSNVSFRSLIFIKLMYMMMVFYVVTKLEEYKFEKGIALGSVIAIGFLTALNNVGFYNHV